jgi:phenylalanyl-tRNA synthetase beta chain
LIGGLVANVAYNLNRKLERVRAFELGRAFLRDPTVKDGELDVAGIRQPMRVAAIAYGTVVEEQWGVAARGVDFFDVKNDLKTLIAPRRARFEPVTHPALHPGRAARVILDDVVIGWIGELHPKWQKKYELPEPPVAFEIDAEPLLRLPLPQYLEVPRFHPVRRDLAVTVDEATPVQAILDGLLRAKSAIVHEVRVFDVYRGKGIEIGKKGLAFRVLLQDTQKTLTDAEVDAAIAGLRKVLEQEYGAKLRQ